MTPTATVTDNKIYANSVEYAHPAHVQFINDVRAKGYTIRLHKKYGYAGPCVRIKDAKLIKAATEVKCTATPMGSDYIVFPTVSCGALEHFVKMNPWL